MGLGLYSFGEGMGLGLYSFGEGMGLELYSFGEGMGLGLYSFGEGMGLGLYSFSEGLWIGFIPSCFYQFLNLKFLHLKKSFSNPLGSRRIAHKFIKNNRNDLP